MYGGGIKKVPAQRLRLPSMRVYAPRFSSPSPPPHPRLSQLRVGDFADFSGPPTQGIWVTVSVTELGAYGELRLSMAINGSDFWVSPDSPGLHWAMCGEKSTGQVPTGEAGAAAAASAVPAVDLAVMRAVDEAALVRVLKGPHASFRAALAVGDLVDAKHFGGNGQWYQVRRSPVALHCGVTH